MLFYAILAATLTITSYGQVTTCDITKGNADCVDNTDLTVVCVDNGSVLGQMCTISCTTQEDCLGILACKGGGCGYCSADSECGTGNTCSAFFTCQFACDTTNGDNDCSGFVAVSKCGGSGYCVQCTSDTDCPTYLDTTCDTNTGECNAYQSCSENTDCGTGQICDTGSCVDEPCTSNDDCATDEVCDAGDCIQDMSCRSDNDCTGPYGDTCGGLLTVEKPVGMCYQPCVDDSTCPFAVFGVTCGDISGLLPCTDCKACFGATSCSTDEDCSTSMLFEDMSTAKCDTNTNVCYISCENESDCTAETAIFTCYDDATLGYKRCVPGATKRLLDDCVTDSDCNAPKNKCFDGTTLMVPNMCYVGCSDNGDCESGETCNTDTNIGFTRCSSSCSVQDDCLTGESCLGGSCYLLCTEDNDCTSGGMNAVCETINVQGTDTKFCDGKRTPPPTPKPTSSPTAQTPAPVTMATPVGGSNKHGVFWVIMIGLSIFSFM
eukprot:334327_1